MATFQRLFLFLFLGPCLVPLPAEAQDKLVAKTPVAFGPYEYEAKPDHPAFAKFFPRKAPPASGQLIREGDRLAIIGDSITEQKMYSRIIETYLTVCEPELNISVRQYGWSGEKADGFLRRMDQDCLRFDPTIATLSYGMNDAKYRPFDITNGLWYRDHYTAVVRKLKSSGARVVLGSPGCSGKIATWVKSRSGTLDEHNLNLCSLRDICIEIAAKEDVRFADNFWPMYQQQVLASEKYGTAERPYRVAGKDGIHPGWAGHVMMAYTYLKALGLSGDLGAVTVDATAKTATANGGHSVDSFDGMTVQLNSRRYPFCARGAVDDESSIRSGTTLVPFHADLNRFTLRVMGLQSDRAEITWGKTKKQFSASALQEGVNLAEHFVDNPFCERFDRVDAAIAAKQAFETHQVKRVFHSKEAKQDFDKVVDETESKRKPLVAAIKEEMKPVVHHISIRSL